MVLFPVSVVRTTGVNAFVGSRLLCDVARRVECAAVVEVLCFALARRSR